MPYIGAGVSRFTTADGLTVSGNASVSGTTALTGNATAAGNLDVTGNVDVDGTTTVDGLTSSAALDVTTSTHANASIFKSTGNTQLFLQDTDASSDDQFWGFQVSGGEFNILTCDDDRSGGFVTPVNISQAGLFGIGASSTASTLHVQGNGARFVNSSDTDALHLFEFDGSNNASAALYDASGTNRIKLATSGSSFIGNGNTGFGDETSPPATVTARHNGTSQSAGQFKATHTSFANDVVKIIATRDNATNEFNMLTVFDNDSDLKMLIRPDGDLENANNSYGGFSDQRYKENIADATSQWDDIKALQIRKYNLIGESPTHIGVIAQELETAGMNGLVFEGREYGEYEDENGDTVLGPLETTRKGVKYSVLYMKAVKALQEAMTRIETLETEMTALKARVTALEDA